MLRSGKAEYHERLGPLLDGHPPNMFENLPSPRVFASHLFSRHLPKNFIEQKGKLVYIYRNPKDVSVSFYTFLRKFSVMPYDGKWEEFFDLWLKDEGKITFPLSLIQYDSIFQGRKKLLLTRNIYIYISLSSKL